MNRDWLDRLRRRLVARGIDAGYVQRLAGELEDHYQSSYARHRRSLPPAEAARRALGDLGDADSIANEVLARPTLRPLARRQPVLAFIVGPCILVALAIGLFSLIEYGILLGATQVLHVPRTDPTLRRVFLGAYQLFGCGTTPTLAIAFCALANRHRCDLRWPLYACCTLSLAGLVKTWLVLCPASGSVFFMNRFGIDEVRLIAPIAVFGAFAWTRRHIVRLTSARAG